ncbi:D-alanine--poly(phosphoribitol) ligase subunit DltC [Vagococcus fluvialis]|uniref:D-alanyl carrier protein n=1 Tax=Vagococcus fluvialis TaxID=2738 RepID=A0A369AQ59_9ENTE|nr:D-alanine--poly(phosphoribitol) ligase subunit DltC [Vagococcus fluvialis]MDR2276561.1 D-alanine--poly(phosphoribitol) ligase subunit DltC [Vagococcus sp.]OTP32054.1 D-alanine-poly(phosphoribitol) ligase, subunit 2 [Enterococcus sp. 6C8_DIV0013]MBO0420933.1 D-alanine--poly(phosphoribitol) ligase subunit DltC [Vagococcus fluvialis]MBO0438564.1 D-alanine--poly(phosphoribitol) ligase subunit DltC [Vagococcus fluvialis]MBO0444229.1 D-alanine--poly(phosphoribitol) ligase subunit DltC [Vagococcus
MDIKETVLAIIEDLTGQDVSGDLDLNLYDDGLLDSMATVQMLVEIDGQLGITVPVSEYERSEWGTPQQIINQVSALA